MSHRMTLALVAVVLAAAGCREADVPEVEDGADVGETIEADGLGDADIPRKVDIVLLVHTAYYQSLFEGPVVWSFPEDVAALLVDAGLDVRIGLLSADMGSPGRIYPDESGTWCGRPCDRADGTSSSDNGLLINTPPCWPEEEPYSWMPDGCGPYPLPGPGVEYPRFLAGDDEDLGSWLACFLDRRDGCPVAQPLESLYQAFEPGRNEGFLREGSILAVFMLLTEDDCSVADAEVLREGHEIEPRGHGAMCAFRQEHLHPLDRYVERLLAVRPPDDLVVAVFAGPDEPYSWCPPLEVCGGADSGCTDATPCLVLRECADEWAYASPRLHDFVRQLGATSGGNPVGFSGTPCAGFAGGWPRSELTRFKDAILVRAGR